MTTLQDPVVDDAAGWGGPATVEWVPVEPWPGPPPTPVLAPYLGLVASVLCALGGGWLLLAPYALDFRHGAAHVPRTASVDLETGAAIVAMGLVTAALFAWALAQRLRAREAETEYGVMEDSEVEFDVEDRDQEQKQEAAAETTAPQQADPGGALRELLTPLVAALAADLRSHDLERDRARDYEHRPESGGPASGSGPASTGPTERSSDA
jgi:hypothetical protein